LRVERKRSLHALGAELAELDAQTRGRDRGQRLRRAGRVMVEMHCPPVPAYPEASTTGLPGHEIYALQ